MRRLTRLVAVATLVAVGGVAHDGIGYGAQVLLAPVHDIAAQTSVRNLALALESYAVVEGSLDRVTVTDLAGWGWEPGPTAEVTIWVAGDRFRAVARDVRPGTAAFEISRTGDAQTATMHRVDAPETPADVPPEPGVTIRRSGL